MTPKVYDNISSLQEKKISTKINYDVLRSLNMDAPAPSTPTTATEDHSILPETPGAAILTTVTVFQKLNITKISWIFFKGLRIISELSENNFKELRLSVYHKSIMDLWL